MWASFSITQITIINLLTFALGYNEALEQYHSKRNTMPVDILLAVVATSVIQSIFGVGYCYLVRHCCSVMAL